MSTPLTANQLAAAGVTSPHRVDESGSSRQERLYALRVLERLQPPGAPARTAQHVTNMRNPAARSASTHPRGRSWIDPRL